jgi:hypothetical protein
VVFVKAPGYFVIVDDFLGEAEHRIELRFPFAPLRVAADASGWVRAVGRRRAGLADARARQRVARARIEPSVIAKSYGCRESAPLVTYSALAALPLRLTTLLLPVESVEAAAPCVQPWLDRALVLAGVER